ncbi:MAG: hypothetical protein RMN53_14560 [Anaerolineae bacterium]|nr:hypothetical protein [Anaerolineae bacterium]
MRAKTETRVQAVLGHGLLFAIAILLALVAMFTVGAAVNAATLDDRPPTPPPGPLNQSRKLASADTVVSGETFTYTIQLVNSGQQDLLVWVADLVPGAVAYVPGSASHGGEYRADTGVLTWEVTVPAGGTVPLTFQVTAGAVETPTHVVNTAGISSVYQRLVRTKQVTILPNSNTPPPPTPTPPSPRPPSGGDLAQSQKLASTETARPGDVITYTIRLVNSGESAATVDVLDRLPMPVAYVDGSANPPAAFDPEQRSLTWEDIAVPAGQTVALTFRATAGQAQVPLVATNRAIISAGGAPFVRSATVVLLPADAPTPPPAPAPILLGSRKAASAYTLTGGQPLTYTVHLVNSGAGDALVDVTDPLPAQVTYVNGSASHGGVYNADTRTLTWTDVTVPAGETVSLVFRVNTASVNRPTPVVNAALIEAEGFSREVKARVLLMPTDLPGDSRPPRVTSVRIGNSDVLTNPNVTLYISAADNGQVTSMKVQEWLLVSEPFPHWEAVAASDWMPFQEELPWTLTNQPGTHYIGVWVSDAAGNLSLLTGSATDFASLLLPGTAVAENGRIAYMVHYQAGEEVTATLQTLTGDADLYVWFPMSFGPPNAFSNEDGTAVDQVSFTAPTTGRYLFVVHGFQASTYNFSIVPGGGASSALKATAALSGKPLPQRETILSRSGLDPIAGAVAPQARRYLRLPLIAR